MDTVDRGVEWLNENGPAEWWDLIDFDHLDMARADSCVAGQVFAATSAEQGGVLNGYDIAWEMLDGAVGICNHGFSERDGMSWSDLRARWIEEIERIRSEVSA